MSSEIVKFESATGQPVKFTADEVRARLCPNITDKELAFTMALCQAQKLNPFTKDVYIIKYGDGPASIVTSKDTFTKRAQANPRFEGMEAGVTVVNNNRIVQRPGSMVLRGETLVGGWCKVYVKGYRVPIFDEVSLSEYSTGKSNWTKMPATMIRKVALCHALREAFPDDFQGLYGEEEMGADIPSEEQTPTQAAAQASAVEAVETVQQPTAAQAPIDAYKLALIRARDERGVPVEEAMARVREIIDKEPAAYDEADIAAAVTIVDGLGQPEPEYEVVEEQLPLSEDDIPF